ncbi:PD-(D/E)XK nuclease family protein [Candidatus Woesebacteria bacterium]|nr:PD-(D/E)XK nuclease family protein [Candidatus Woesebacteria bacterium]
MSKYYNPKRGSDWNYGGRNWKLSRSKLELFLECPKCFYLDNKLGTKRPPGYPFNLNTAVDTLLKKEFDILRAKGEKHPLQKEYGVDAVPVPHEDLDEWRDNFKGVAITHEKTGMIVTGAIDDLWIDSNDNYIVVDYKSTSTDEQITELTKDHHESYKRQMEIYQWLLRQKGYKVSDKGYFVYCNGRTDVEAFDGKIEFDVTLIEYVGDDSWVENTIIAAHKCLESDDIPKSDEDCDYCAYRKTVEKLEK